MPLTNMKLACLADRAVLRVAGEEARDFLQGLVCNNMEKLEKGEAFGNRAIHTGLLTPQGKIMFDFFVVRVADGYLIDCAADKADELLKRLMFYRLRAKVDLEKMDGLGVVAGWLPEAVQMIEKELDISILQNGGAAFEDSRLPGMGYRLVVVKGHADAIDNTALDYNAHRIGLGVPEGGKDYGWSDIFPHDACFDLLHGVDFSKGCYVGQEVVSKMHHKATLRKRFVIVQGKTDLPSPGSEIKGGISLIGLLGSVSGNEALSLVRLDRAQKAVEKGNSFAIDNMAVKLVRPDWADYDVPNSDG